MPKYYELKLEFLDDYSKKYYFKNEIGIIKLYDNYDDMVLNRGEEIVLNGVSIDDILTQIIKLHSHVKRGFVKEMKK